MKVVGWLVIGAEGLALLWLGWLYSRHSIVISFEKGADVATLVLTAAAVVVTGVGVIMGVAAVWGFKEIKEQAVQAAVKAALEHVNRELRKSYSAGEVSLGSADANELAKLVDEEFTTDEH